MSSRKITLVIGSLDLGGAEKHISLIAPPLKKLGWDLEIYCLTRRGIQADQVEKAGVRVIGPPSEIEETQGRLAKLARLIASSIKLFIYLAWRRPTIVHFFLPAAYLIGAPIAVAARIPIRLMSRRSLNLYQKKHPTLARLEHFMHRRMQMLLGNSQAVLKQLQAEAPETVPVELIYNGVEIGDVNAASDQRGKSGALTLIIVANLIPYKGHADLLRALGAAANSLPPSWTLLCVGRDDGIGSSLIDLARELSIDAHIRLLGSQSDVSALLASADVGILCSHEEGFSNAILESMAAGLPMIVTDVGGNAEAVLDRETGYVVPPHDPAALGAAIVALAANADLRKQMGATGRRRVETHFSITRCVEDYDNLYCKLIDNAGRKSASKSGARRVGLNSREA